jgi:hypothetical protein
MRKEGSVEDYITRSLIICTPIKYYSGDQIKKNEICGAFGTYRREERCRQIFGGET